ncbi:hypothetical protein N7468_001368 [Penicillium chermesinum]|uniref:Uncharacterized protein n=1 Tax=Penicillium chermesinum TaxID=63820 RepID=A0A9W9TWQ2_9EURO|nr:uncharacterized protein N7468_001368 [Penicillium chermesinum]KAJ5246385.1 hypothetical protein N7468_001368 [Penicillium chermesinum]
MRPRVGFDVSAAPSSEFKASWFCPPKTVKLVCVAIVSGGLRAATFAPEGAVSPGYERDTMGTFGHPSQLPIITTDLRIVRVSTVSYVPTVDLQLETRRDRARPQP